jgi:hypothetical protein
MYHLELAFLCGSGHVLSTATKNGYGLHPSSTGLPFMRGLWCIYWDKAILFPDTTVSRTCRVFCEGVEYGSCTCVDVRGTSFGAIKIPRTRRILEIIYLETTVSMTPDADLGYTKLESLWCNPISAVCGCTVPTCARFCCFFTCGMDHLSQV